MNVTPSPVHREADALGLTVHTPLNFRDEAERWGVAGGRWSFAAQFGDLDDDGIARVRVTLNSMAPEAATPGNYQLAVSRDGQQLFKERGDAKARVGSNEDMATGTWTSKMPFGDWLNGTYEFELIYANDTDQRVTVQLLVEDATVPAPAVDDSL